jgi:D-lyxose ketol-isomerase
MDKTTRVVTSNPPFPDISKDQWELLWTGDEDFQKHGVSLFASYNGSQNS